MKIPEYLDLFTKQNAENYLGFRYDLSQEDETLLDDGSQIFGQNVSYGLNDSLELPAEVQYLIIGIAEDIGVRANHGRGGASEAWKDFLKTFLNLQQNRINDAGRFCILGEIKLDDLMNQSVGLDANDHMHRRELSELVTEVDTRVKIVVEWVKSFNKIPVFIGGGHNNCYPLLSAYGQDESIDCINIDAHTDLRSADGRHSGNGFRYALEKGVLARYFMMGLNTNYFSLGMEKLISSNSDLGYCNMDELKNEPEKKVKEAFGFIRSHNYSLEIDMDIVADFPSSAQSPIGITFDQLCYSVSRLAKHQSNKPKYIHICEAAPKFGYPNQVGKALAHLVNLFK